MILTEENRIAFIESEKQKKLINLVLNADEVELKAMRIILDSLGKGMPASYGAFFAAEYLKDQPGYKDWAARLMMGALENEY